MTMYTKQNKSASIFLGTGTSGKPSTGNAIGGGKAAIERNIEDKPKGKLVSQLISSGLKNYMYNTLSIKIFHFLSMQTPIS